MFTTIRNAWKIEDLRRKMIYTLFILLIFRLGSAIPVPFINSEYISKMILGDSGMGGFFGYLDTMSGGALASASLFALGISPHITSSIVIQLLTIAIPYLENLQKEGPEGQKRIQVITRYTTLILAVLQSTAYYVLNRNAGGVAYTAGGYGVFTALVIVSAFTAGAMMVVWLGEQIDVKGIGNGISIILFVGIISRAPNAFKTLLAEFQKGGSRLWLIPVTIIVFLALIYAIVVMTNAERRIPIQYAKRVVGRKMYGGQASFIPIKVTMSGVMPVIFAGAMLSLPSLIGMFVQSEGPLASFLNMLGYDKPLYAILYFLLILAFNYFYVAITYNPLEMANDLRKNSGTIPGIRPGEPTAKFISNIISRITLAGAFFIAIVAIMPIILGSVAKLPIALGGTSVIILVNVALEIGKSLESMMMMRHYKGFLE